MHVFHWLTVCSVIPTIFLLSHFFSYLKAEMKGIRLKHSSLLQCKFCIIKEFEFDFLFTISTFTVPFKAFLFKWNEPLRCGSALNWTRYYINDSFQNGIDQTNQVNETQMQNLKVNLIWSITITGQSIHFFSNQTYKRLNVC